jgi:hypothetical protein
MGREELKSERMKREEVKIASRSVEIAGGSLPRIM